MGTLRLTAIRGVDDTGCSPTLVIPSRSQPVLRGENESRNLQFRWRGRGMSKVTRTSSGEPALSERSEPTGAS